VSRSVIKFRLFRNCRLRIQPKIRRHTAPPTAPTAIPITPPVERLEFSDELPLLNFDAPGTAPELVEVVPEVPERDNEPEIAVGSEVKDEERGEWSEDKGVVEGVEMDAVERRDEVVVDGVLVEVVVVVEVVEVVVGVEVVEVVVGVEVVEVVVGVEVEAKGEQQHQQGEEGL